MAKQRNFLLGNGHRLTSPAASRCVSRGGVWLELLSAIQTEAKPLMPYPKGFRT